MVFCFGIPFLKIGIPFLKIEIPIYKNCQIIKRHENLDKSPNFHVF